MIFNINSTASSIIKLFYSVDPPHAPINAVRTERSLY